MARAACSFFTRSPFSNSNSNDFLQVASSPQASEAPRSVWRKYQHVWPCRCKKSSQCEIPKGFFCKSDKCKECRCVPTVMLPSASKNPAKYGQEHSSACGANVLSLNSFSLRVTKVRSCKGTRPEGRAAAISSWACFIDAMLPSQPATCLALRQETCHFKQALWRPVGATNGKFPRQGLDDNAKAPVQNQYSDQPGGSYAHSIYLAWRSRPHQKIQPGIPALLFLGVQPVDSPFWQESGKFRFQLWSFPVADISPSSVAAPICGTAAAISPGHYWWLSRGRKCSDMTC